MSKSKNTEASSAKTEAEANTAIAVQAPTDLADSTFDLLGSAAALAGAGQEKIGVKETAIPTLRILQSNSHEIAKGDSKFVEGASVGDFYAITPEGPRVFRGDQGIQFYVAAFDKVWLEWVPIEKGGGFAGRHPSQEVALQNRKDKDNQIDETWEYYGLVVTPGLDPFPVLFGCSKSKLTPARHWNGLLKGLREKDPKTGNLFVPPTWYVEFTLKTKSVTNKMNQRYFNFEAIKGGTIQSRSIFEQCQQLREAVRGGVLEQYTDAVVEDVTVTDADIPNNF